MIWTVAKKELRGYFNSAVAVIFLAAFLAVAFYTFFWREKFFARGLADLRPLFESMPVILIILVSALSMRLWAEERRAGTLEILLTLPVPRWKLVVGKFVAGMLLIAIALGLTLGLPITVAQMGNLDTGPVIGGYAAALLLSGAYLSIGMCVSAATDNQIIAFVGTAFLCVIAYAVGEFDASGIGRLIGTGARFESVARGVLDLRDLAYYGSIMATGIALNVLLLSSLTWSRGPRAQARRMGAMLGVGLVAANALALNVWLAPVGRARIDLTDTGAYSLSSSTKKIVGGLEERLLIRGYFSEKTHPKLAPLIPQIRDLLEEYRVAGGDKVRVEIIDPTDSNDAKREAKERFNIDPTPLRFATETEKSVVNSYFSIAIEYGDQHEVLGLNELIQVRVQDVGELEISLRNLEYQVTKTVKKVVSGFSSIDALFAQTPGPVKLTAYITPKTLPENWQDAPAKLKKVVDELAKESNGKLSYTTVEPNGDAQMQELYRKYGLRPYAELLSNNIYYFNLLLELGDRVVRIVPPDDLSEAGIKAAITDGLKRGAPGFTKVVGLWSPPEMAQRPAMPGMPPQGMPPPQTFQTLQRSLAGNYEVRPVQLDAKVPDDVEVLVLGGPANLDPKAAEYVDQFVMRGGSLVVLAGRYRLAPSNGIAIEKVTTGLEGLFKKWGIKVDDDLVMDTKSDSFPVPRERDLGNGMIVREIEQRPYAAFVKLDGKQLASSSVITSGLAGSVVHWGSPVTAETKVGEDEHRVEALLESTANAWLTDSTTATPDWSAYPETGFPGPEGDGKRGRQTLAVAVTGGFASGVAKPEAGAAGAAPDASKQRLLEHSPPDTRIVVFGSSAFVSDDLLGLAQQLESDLAMSNVELVHNAVDWALADTDLLAIRAHTTAARALTVDPDSRGAWRTGNIIAALIGLLAVVAAAYARRRAVQPYVTAKEV